MIVLIDCDGTLTDGRMFYDETGKVMKAFCARDSEMIRQVNDVIIISADKTGELINRRRADDMGVEYRYMSSQDRADFARDNEVVLIADSNSDLPAMKAAKYGVAVGDADPRLKEVADYVCYNNGGRYAVAEAIEHLISLGIVSAKHS